MAPVQLQDRLFIWGFEGLVQGSHIGPQQGGVDTYFFGAPRQNHALPQGFAKEGESRGESRPGAFFVGVGPERGQKGVTAMKPPRPSESQIGQEGEALGLGQEGSDFPPVGISKIQRAKEAEGQHDSGPSAAAETENQIC
jgi:hypothetical protein